MTARTTTLRGSGAGLYYVEGQLGYYLDTGEPPGRWFGAGAALLGLDGDVDEEHFLNLMDGLDPRTGRLLGSGHTEQTARGFDLTPNAPKGVSALAAVGGPGVRDEVLAGHDAAVAAVIDWIERHAHCRYRVNGKVCVFDAHGIVVAAFRQHTSRALDPHLHTHIVIVNRVKSPDGRWLALDARTLKKDQRTLSRIYHASLRTELTARLGIRWQEPENGIAEPADIPDDVLVEFSRRTRAYEKRLDDKLERFNETFERAPTPRERWRLEREAVLDSRPPKADADPVTLEQEWRQRLDGLGISPQHLVAGALDRAQPRAGIDHTEAQLLVDRALDALAEQQSTWRPAELVRELAAAVPTTLSVPADQLVPWLDALADKVIAARLVDLSHPIPEHVPLRRDGRPITEAALDRVLTLPSILAQEERLVALAERRIEQGGVDHEIGSVEGLDPAQRALAIATAGDWSLVLGVGPGGTGKTHAVRPAIEQLRREGRPVFGVAPSAAAAEVLANDSSVDADTLDKLLIEHTLVRRPDHRYDLPMGTTVIVDEAAMISTPRLAELFELAQTRAWRLVLIGDPLQFAAVGRSGMFGHLVDTFGAIELGRIHRFAHAWERGASLRLRRGDTTAVDLYDRHGRLHGGTARQMQRAVVDGWWDTIQRGETALMMAPTNAAVVTLNLQAQRRRLEAGQLANDGRHIPVGPYDLHVGDLVATRHNDRKLKTDRGLMVKNRDRWIVDLIHRDGSLTVQGKTGGVRLPAEYVGEHVELAYAQTSHANQGRTADRSFLYLDGPTGGSGVYVPMTRGRESNEAFVVLHGEETPADVVVQALSRSWIDRPAIAVRAEMTSTAQPRSDDSGRSELPLEAHELRRLLQREADLAKAIAQGQSRIEFACRAHDSASRERDRLRDSIRCYREQLAEAHRSIEKLDRPMMRRRHRAELDAVRGRLMQLPQSIEDATAKLATQEMRLEHAVKAMGEAAAMQAHRPQLLSERASVLDKLSLDARARGERVATRPPPRFVETLGSVPEPDAGAAVWIDAAGRLAQHHAAFPQRGTSLLGRDPGLLEDDVYAASHRSAYQAIERLGRALGRQPEIEIEPPHRSLGRSL